MSLLYQGLRGSQYLYAWILVIINPRRYLRALNHDIHGVRDYPLILIHHPFSFKHCRSQRPLLSGLRIEDTQVLPIPQEDQGG